MLIILRDLFCKRNIYLSFRRQLFSDVFLVTNADKYKHFERWATASDFPVENIINDGSTTEANSIGAVADFELALQIKNLWEYDILVIAGDMLFQVYCYLIGKCILVRMMEGNELNSAKK